MSNFRHVDRCSSGEKSKEATKHPNTLFFPMVQGWGCRKSIFSVSGFRHWLQQQRQQQRQRQRQRQKRQKRQKTTKDTTAKTTTTTTTTTATTTTAAATTTTTHHHQQQQQQQPKKQKTLFTWQPGNSTTSPSRKASIWLKLPLLPCPDLLYLPKILSTDNLMSISRYKT